MTHATKESKARKLPENRLTRFSDRVQDYVKYRPGYPTAAIQFLKDHVGFARGKICADIGSGTGIFSALLLKEGMSVFGVEPNREMREAAGHFLSNYPDFRSLEGTAESTGLPAKSVDFVTAAQAFHWFETDKAKAEFRRILKPEGKVILIYNTRLVSRSEFLLEYENILKRFATDYAQVWHSIDEQGSIESFLNPGTVQRFSCPNQQTFDFEGLKGRLLSSSYAPKKEHPNHEPMMEALEQVFAKHQRNGKVCFEYDTEVTAGGV